MTPSATCAAFIKGFEQCRLKAYMPTPNDKPTIGWGSTGADIHLGLTWAQAECDERFARDLAAFGVKVSALLADAETTQGQYDAMVSLAYNIGIHAFADSSVLRLHRLGKPALAADAFMMWTRQAGQMLTGLVRRRNAEAAMYRKATPA